MNTSYDVIICHSLGGPVALELLPFFPKNKETTVILVDPALELTEEIIERRTELVLMEMSKVRPAEEHMAENPAWSRRNCVLRALGVSMCDPSVVETFRVIFQLLKWEALLMGPAFVTNSITGHGLSVAC